MTLHRVASIPQVGGEVRHILMTSASDARRWRDEIRRDRAMIDAACGDYHIDTDGDRLIASRAPGKMTAAEWRAVREAIR